MRARILTNLFAGLICCVAAAGAASADIYQDFELNNGSDEYAWPLNGASILLIGGGEPHFGGRSLRVSGTNFNGFGVQSQQQRWDMDFAPERNDRLAFWVHALPLNQTDNNVSVRFFDHGTYHAGGFEVWTTQTARYGQWTQLKVLFSQLPADFDLHHIDKLEFVNYWPGVYYFDNIEVLVDDRVYQSFEPTLRAGSTESEYGWKWNDADSAGFSGPGEPVKEGEHSWKLVAAAHWSGTGLQSQEQKLDSGQQTFWHIDLQPQFNDRLTFWVYALPQNGLDNNVSVQFYDHGQHFTDDTKAVAWTARAAHYGEWTRLTVQFSDLPPTLDLHNLNKIQLQVYWPGTYYFDEIRATGPIKEIDRASLPEGRIRWDSPNTTGTYVIRSSPTLDGTWSTYWSSVDHAFWTPDVAITSLIPAWYQLNNSDPVYYQPPVITIDAARLKAGFVEWRTIPQTDAYEVEAAPGKTGPWTRIHLGAAQPLPAMPGEWYRARAVSLDQNGEVGEASDWGPAISYAPNQGFIVADRTDLREANGTGPVITLRGVNLGALFVNEPWMTGIGEADVPPVPDDYSLREVLEARFGADETRALLAIYQDAYLNEDDFDILYRLGVNAVRLPVWYRLLQDEAGNWLLNDQGQIDFSPIDRVIAMAADRGLYVILDLHGAPGAQNNEMHAGRAGYNKLFELTAAGQAYRDRTVALWQALAQHYRDEPAIAGYDLLNEPVGAPMPQELWALYDRLYDAIRAIDTRHVIMMEGIWDWNTLPRPSIFGWQNVLYQVHYYLFDAGEDLAAHQAFLDEQIAQARGKQLEYQVPAMVGEFTGFSMRPIWELYLNAFNEQGWSWLPWSYKFHGSPSDWGLYNHADYDAELPKLRTDDAATLGEKFARYGTLGFHVPNPSLLALLSEALAAPFNHRPELAPVEPRSVKEAKLLTVAFSATDPDGDPLTFSVEPLPSGATVTGNTLTWTPGYGQAGVYPVVVSASDGHVADTQAMTITVLDRPLVVESANDGPDPFSPNGDGVRDTTTLRGRYNHVVTGGKIVVKSSGGQAVWVSPVVHDVESIRQEWAGEDFQGQRVPDGAYTYTVIGKDAGGLATRSGTVTVAMPDLTATALTVSPESPLAGQLMTVTATVKNPSLARIAASQVRIQVGAGTLVMANVPGLNPGAMEKVSRKFTAPAPGQVDVSAIADPLNAVLERDETNNARSLTVTVR